MVVDDTEQQLVAHVQRASDLLKAGDVAGAETEGDLALLLAPEDARAKNLIGLLRFRTGKYDEAHRIYTELVGEDPEDLSLRLNLGLVELRMGRHAEAADNLHRLVDKEPGNSKAQGYYGLALMRSGNLAGARQAFVAAGQQDLVRQVEAQMAALGIGVAPAEAAAHPAEPERAAIPPATRLADAPASPVLSSEAAAAMKMSARAAAPPAIPMPAPLLATVPVPSPAPQLSHAPSTAQPAAEPAPGRDEMTPPAPSPSASAAAPAPMVVPAAPQATPAGRAEPHLEILDAADSVPPVRRAPQEEPLWLRGPQPLAQYVGGRTLRIPELDETFLLADGGLLLVRVSGHLPTRISGALVSSGTLAYAPLARRVRGHATDEPFGEGDDLVCLASGEGAMVVSPRGRKFTVLSLSDDVLYLRESLVFAFEDNLAWENGRIPGSHGERVVQFRGDGKLVMRSDRKTYTLRVTQGEVLYADQDVLLGWTGEVVPQQLRGHDGNPTPFVACSGQGALILADFADARPVSPEPPAQ